MGCPDAELSIVITDDAAIRALNRDWRSKDQPTDVLSFSQIEVPESEAPPRGQTRRGRAVDPRALGPRPVLGDVVISAETAARQAPRYGHDFEVEIERLVVHGVLHLLGHDHVHGGPQARRMREEEERLLRALGQGRARAAVRRALTRGVSRGQKSARRR